jgi:tRNA(fMet)-specific endonuclease VapC
MDLFVLDTDILTLFQRGHATVVSRVAAHTSDRIAITVVTVEEQLSGWYAELRKAKDVERLAWAYQRLAANVRFLARMEILDFDQPAIQRYEDLKRRRLKVRKMDLQIAAIAHESGGILVTRNVQDFKKVPGLIIQDWSK